MYFYLLLLHFKCQAEGQVTRAVFLPFSRWRPQVALPCPKGSYWAQLQQQQEGEMVGIHGLGKGDSTPTPEK